MLTSTHVPLLCFGGNASQEFRTCNVSVMVNTEKALLATPLLVITSSVVLGTVKSPATVGSGASSDGIWSVIAVNKHSGGTVVEVDVGGGVVPTVVLQVFNC